MNPIRIMHVPLFSQNPNTMSFSDRMIALRRERNLTQQAFAKAFGVTTDWLLFEEAERGPDDDLRLQFEAMAQLSPEEKSVARAVLEGLLLKHAARQWNSNPSRAGS
jgi:transcriptional regulator with XRE-family HTH domain